MGSPVQSSLCASKLFIMVRLNPLSAALASLLPFVAAHPFDLWTRDDFRGECGTVTTAEDLAAIAAVAGQGSSSFSSVSAKGFSAAAVPSYSIEPWLLGDITVKTWMHVVAVNQTVEGGWIPDDQLASKLFIMVRLNPLSAALASLLP